MNVNRMWMRSIGAAGLAIAALPVAADKRIEDIAPESTIVVVGIDSLERTVESVKSGALWEMWKSPEIQELVGEKLDEFALQLTLIEEQLDLEPGSLKHPSGGVGAALYLAMDEDLGMETLAMIGIADFEDKENLLARALDAALEQAEAAGREYNTHEVGETQIYEFTIEAPEDVDEMDPMGMPDPMAMVQPMMEGLKKLFICRSGGALLVSSHLPTLSDALDKLDGGGEATIADSTRYQNSLAQVGAGDTHIVLMIDNAVKAANTQPTVMMFGPMLTQTLRELGLDNVKAASISVDLSPQNGIMDQRVGVLVEGGKKGLIGLFDTETGRGDLPRFVSERALGYSRFNVEFDGMMDVINGVIDSLPPQVQPQAEEFMLQYGPDLNAFFGSLGRDVHIVTLGSTPFVVLRTTSAARFEGVLAKYAPMMQLEARDFLGSTIYGNEFGDFAIGLGGGYAFIAEPENVEMALRAMRASDPVSLANSEKFQYAVSHLRDDDVVAWGFSDPAAMFDQIMDPMGAFGGMPMAFGPDEEKVIELMKKHLGPVVWQMNSVDNGFVIVYSVLRAQNPAR